VALGTVAVSLCAAAACFGPAEPNGSGTPPFIERGDFPTIRERRTLRVLVPRLDRGDFLPRRGTPLDDERELIDEFARREGLDPFWVYVDARADLIPFLLEGKGDVVAANLTTTPERRERVAFTVPLRLVREQVVTRRSDTTVVEAADLEGRRVAVRRSSSFWGTLDRLRQRYPAIDIQEVPEDLDTDEILHRVATRRLDVTVADSNVVEDVLGYRDDLRVACDLTESTPVAWAVRPDAPRLLRRLNRFLSEAQLSRRGDDVHFGDLDDVQRRKVLRLLTRNTSATYYLWRGKLMGFEYELAQRFAQRLGVRLEVIVPQRGEDLLQMLAEGRGDLVAAAQTPVERPGVAFSEPYNFVSQIVVAPAGEAGLASPRDLAHRTVYVHHSSPHWDTLSRLRDGGLPLILQAAPQHLETEELIGLVGNGVYPLTVADSHLLDIELTWRDDVAAAFPLGEPVPLAWGVRAANPELLAAVNRFIRTEYKGLTYNVLHRRYFEDPKRMRHHVLHRRKPGELSPWDRLVKRYADEHDFDWRLIVAQMHHESGFDPTARSFAGAVGLLQVLPSTAAELDLFDLEDPENNVRAGIRYLAWVRDRFEEELPVRDRMWFTLAGYNAGPDHVRDARRLAAEKGWNPDRWFDNVERAMLLLSRPEYARRAQHGYCRGQEPVQYVREIRSTYEAYVDLLARDDRGEPVARAASDPA
jgi:membrane-bound lytic murein transglycosylase F